ncbi:MAG: hypothetical protein WBG92_06320 [Thiohalocapsa sp.]
MNTTINTSANKTGLNETDTTATMRIVRRMLILSLLPAAFGAQAACLTDAPEIGDIGPGSDLVCDQLQNQFPGAALAVESRVIHSPTDVSVLASVDGTPMRLRYNLAGYVWHLSGADNGIADVAAREQGRSMGK